MDPVTLHFNVFQAGAEGRQSLQVEDPRGTTILALKKQLFPDAVKASKSVRFIALGRILDDSAPLERCGLGNEAHIHVSISDGASSPKRAPAASPDDSSATAAEAKSPSLPESANCEESAVSWIFLAGVAMFVGTGAALYAAFRKRRQFTLHTSQLLFICAAVWVYLLLCHGLPALFQALCNFGRSMSTSSTSKDTSPICGIAGIAAGAVNEAPSGASSSSTASSAPAAAAGLSLMTPTLAAGDATAAASVLTQRR